MWRWTNDERMIACCNDRTRQVFLCLQEVVTRSIKGKVFLKCTSSACKEIAYLTPEITNWYIDREHVTCPIHHCGIQSGLGKYGIYVKCDRGHFLKPDEI